MVYRFFHFFNLHASASLEQRLAKPWEEPLLAAHDQAKLNLMARKEAKIEAKRLAEEEQRHRERQQREVTFSMHIRSNFSQICSQSVSLSTSCQYPMCAVPYNCGW